jgi:hypothetical protein
VRALLCVLLRQPIRAPDGSLIEPDKSASMVLERGPDALVRICARVDKQGKSTLASSSANRILDVGPNGRAQAKGWIQALDARVRGDVLDAHHISGLAWQALIAGDHRAFVEERIKTLIDLERRFMAEKGVTPPQEDYPAPSAIDIEDEVPRSEDLS